MGNSPNGGAWQGDRCCFYHGTVVAEVAEVSLDEQTGQIQLRKVVAAMDCGRVINPDLVRSQMEGSIVMGASSALIEELTVKDSRLVAGSFAEYPIFTIAEVPEIETIILETPNRNPSGSGEPPIGPVAPAIGNAFFSLTGVRLRQLPMTPARVREELRTHAHRRRVDMRD